MAQRSKKSEPGDNAAAQGNKRDQLPTTGAAFERYSSLDDYHNALEELQESQSPFGLIYIGVPDLIDTSIHLNNGLSQRLIDVVSKRLSRCVRGSDDAFQVDDSHYIVVIRGAYDVGAYQSLRNRIKHAVEAEVVLDDRVAHLSVDFGYARFPEDGATYQQIVERAKDSMERVGRSRQRITNLEEQLESTTEHIDQADDSGPMYVGTEGEGRPFIDELTGLPDALYFRGRAARLIADAQKRSEGLSLVFCDIEKFKEYNLKFGYHSGDDLLIYIADTLEQAFPGDLVARLNSDRFGIVTHTEGLTKTLEHVHDTIRSFKMNSSIEFKAGICDVAEDGFNVNKAQDYARLACDSIKGRYDQIWRRFDDKLANEVERRQHIIDNLDSATEQGWIEVFYQPIIRTLNGEMCGLEALTRWNDPKFGMLPPGEFIDVLEDAHLIHKLDSYMVKRVCADGRRALDEGRPVGISINLSRLDYQLCDIFGVVEEAAEQAGLPRHLLHIEFTETAFTEDAEFFQGILDRFRNAGYEIWMDDFGSGYSSLNLLKDYNFDVLKIDMGFLRGLEQSPRTRDIISSVVDMAKKLGIQTLAEGVETPEQFAFLKSIGCEKVQGYLFCKPERIEEINKKLNSGDLAIEKADMQQYYDSLGKVNMLSPSPFVLEEERSQNIEFASAIPLALVEYVDTSLYVIYSSPAFDETLIGSGLGSIVEGMVKFSDRGLKIVSEFMHVAEKAKESGDDEYIDFYDFEDIYTLRALFVSSGGNRDSFLISLTKHDVASAEENDFQLKGERMVYLPQAQDTPWQQSSEIDLEHTAVVVIDVLGGTEGITPGLEEMAANCVRIVKAARKAGVPVIFSDDNHIKGLDQELDLWGDHGIRGEQNGLPLVEFEVCDSDFIIPKRRYNGFFQTDLELTLRELGVNTLIVVGADTNICVLQTLAGAYFYGYKTIVPADATATFLVGNQEDGLEYFTRCYDTRVIDVATVMNHLEEGAQD